MQLTNLATKYDAADAALLTPAPGAGALATVPVQQPANEPAFDFVGVSAPALVIICDFIAKRYGEHWKADMDEAKELMQAYDRLLPSDWNMSPTGAALVATGAFIAPRALMTAMQKEKPQGQTMQQTREQTQEKPQGKPQGNPGKNNKPATTPQSSRGK